MKKKIFIVAAVIFSNQLQAQQQPANTATDSTKNLDEVVVTANKYPQKQSTTGKVISIIGKDVLEKSFGRTVADILNQQTGIVVPGSQNILGSNQELYLRGSSKVLLLIDGVPAYDASYIGAGFDLNQLPLQSIERIEILKGGQSTLYGSDAVAGVINIITKKGGTKPINLYGGASAGSFGTYKVNAGIGGKSATTSYNINYNYANSKGFSSATDRSGNKNFDKDGFNQNAITANFTAALSKKLQVRLNGQYSHYTTDFDGAAFTDDKDYTGALTNGQAGVNVQYKTGKGTVYLNSNYNSSNRKYTNDSFDVSGFSSYSKEQYRGNSFFTDLYTVQPIAAGVELLAGTDYRLQNSTQDYLSISMYGPYATNIAKDSVKNNMYSFYTSLLLKNMGRFNAEFGGRFNNHSQYGNSFTYTFNPSFNLNAHWKLFVNVSSAFKAPSLYQLFGPGVANRKLEAEKSVTYETGVQYTNKNYNLRVVYFYRTIKDGIDYNYVTNAYFNNNKQKDQGLELEAGLHFGNFTFNANYSYITGKVNSWKYKFDPNSYSYTVDGDTTYNNLFRRPTHALNATAGYQATKKLYFSSTLRVVGKRNEGQFDVAPIVMASYYTIDLYVGYKVHTATSLFADVRNIANQPYFDVLGYNARKFNITAGVRFAF
jgi:vitamin B12 transporter